MGGLRDKIGEGWCNIDPQRTRSHFWGFLRYVCANCDESRSINATVRVLADGHTDRRKPILLANSRSRSRSSICRLSSVTYNVRAPYSGDWNFRQCFTPFGTLAICDLPMKILRRSSRGKPLRWVGRRVKPKRAAK